MLSFFLLTFILNVNFVQSQRPSAGCGRTSPFTRSAFQDSWIMSNSLNRTYNIYLPASYNVNNPTPVVFLFHGGGGNGITAEVAYGFNSKSESVGFIGVFPDGYFKTWNAGACCSPATTLNTQDVRFVSELIDALGNMLCIDLSRVYSTGMSNGALLSHRLGCELSNKIAAIAPVAGTLGDSSTTFYFTCAPPRPVPVLHIHGLGDLNVPFDGGIGCGPSGTFNFTSVPYTLNKWLSINQCGQTYAGGPSTFVVQQNSNISTYLNGGCATTPVKFVYVLDGGHSWPGGLKLGNSSGCGNSTYWIGTIGATDLIWDFFSQFSLPGTGAPTIPTMSSAPTPSVFTNAPTPSAPTPIGTNAPTTPTSFTNAPTLINGPTNTPTPPTNQSFVPPPSGLSSGAIAGIVIGAIFGVVLVAAIIALVAKTVYFSTSEHV